MRYLSLAEVLELHRRVIAQTGGLMGVRDLGTVESAIAQPRVTFGGRDLYSSREDKAAALCFSLVKGHPFLDGNKRTGHAAMETFLLLNGAEIGATVDEQEKLMLSLASGEVSRDHLLEWLRSHVVPLVEEPPGSEKMDPRGD